MTLPINMDFFYDVVQFALMHNHTQYGAYLKYKRLFELYEYVNVNECVCVIVSDPLWVSKSAVGQHRRPPIVIGLFLI